MNNMTKQINLFDSYNCSFVRATGQILVQIIILVGYKLRISKPISVKRKNN